MNRIGTHDKPLSEDEEEWSEALEQFFGALDVTEGGPARSDGLDIEDVELLTDDDYSVCMHNIKMTEACKHCDELVDAGVNPYDDNGQPLPDAPKQVGERWDPQTNSWVPLYSSTTTTKPTQCDHGKPLEPNNLTSCEDCNKGTGNTANQPEVWRKVKGVTLKLKGGQWVNTGGSVTTPYTSYAIKNCKHYMDEVVLENGLTVYASAWRDAPYHDKRKKEDYPDVAVYLESSWVRGAFVATPGLEVPWDHGENTPFPFAWFEWPDFGVPDDLNDLVLMVKWMLHQAESGKIVETGCMGAHGRTGTLLACLLAAQGITPGVAIKRIRTEYCEHAIESEKQCDVVAKVYEAITGDKTWRKSKSARKAFGRAKDATGGGKWKAVKSIVSAK